MDDACRCLRHVTFSLRLYGRTAGSLRGSRAISIPRLCLLSLPIGSLLALLPSQQSVFLSLVGLCHGQQVLRLGRLGYLGDKTLVYTGDELVEGSRYPSLPQLVVVVGTCR